MDTIAMLILFLVIFGILGVIGYVMNIIKLIGSLNKPITGMFFVRIIGIFVFFIGAIAGWA
jgi:hypothetical protein